MKEIEVIRNKYNKNKLNKIDKDFLEFEENMITKDDLKKVIICLEKNIKLNNPYNSIILYLTDISDEFNFNKYRCDTVGGSPPDVDTDYSASGREDILRLVAEKWGRENVANIITHGTLKPRSATKSYFRVTTPEDITKQTSHLELQAEILNKIPDSLFGKEPTIKEVIEGNKDKGYEPHPELLNDKYKGWYKFASSLEEMIVNFGIHASGVVISDFPIVDKIPLWSTEDAERITQYDMKETEELGLLKFDFLGISNLDIIQETINLIKQRHNIDIDFYKIEDYDERAYKLLAEGYVSGIFQFETSKSAHDLLVQIKPQNIEELSAISSIDWWK